MNRATFRVCMALITALISVSLAAMPGTASPDIPLRDDKSRRLSAPIEHRLQHSISLQDAASEAPGFPARVIGFGYSNPAVSGAFFPSATYSREQFLEDFAAEHASLPQIVSFFTAPGTLEDLQKAQAKKVPVRSPKFTSPQPPKEGSRSQQMLNQLQPDASPSVQSLAVEEDSWFPEDNEIRTYDSGGNAVVKSSYKWNQGSGSLSNFDSKYGFEAEIHLRSDGKYSGVRPFCYELFHEEPASMDTVKKHFWAQNQNWSSWSVATLVSASPGAESIEAYADYNDLGDGCDTQSIAVGIGRPANIPGQTQTTYGFSVSIVAPPGEVPVNHLYTAGLQAVSHDCGLPWGNTAHTDCMAVTQLPYPTSDGYHIALNENGAAYPSDPSTRVPVYTPDVCWTLVTGAVPQRVSCFTASPKCSALSTDAELACWMEEGAEAQSAYEAANGTYFGKAEYSNQPDRPFAAPQLAGIPLKNGMWQETWRSSTEPEWDYNAYTSYMVDRDGFFWRQSVYHEINQPDGLYVDEVEKMGVHDNINYACDFVTPADLNSLCARVGTPIETYRVKATDNDSAADADVAKVIQAQLDYLIANGELYGGYNATVEVMEWADTTYPAKVWNYSGSVWDPNNVYSRIMVSAPNGDLYTAQYQYWRSAPSTTDPTFVYRYSQTMVDRVCSRPFSATYNQTSDIGTCSTMGYPNFKP